MSLRALLALALCLAAAVAAVLWLERRPDAEEEGEGEALTTLPPEEIAAVEVARGSQSVRLERHPEVGWVLTAPLEEARSDAAEALVRGVVQARVRRVLEPQAPETELSAFGLAQPEVAVTLFPKAAGASPVRVRLGGTSLVSSDRYAIDGAGRLLLVESALAGTLEVSRDALAERRLLPAHASEIAALRVERPAGQVRLERDPVGWRMRAPLQDRADPGDADAWVRSLVALERSGPLPDSERARAVVTVTATLTGGRTLPAVALWGTYAARAARLPGALPVQGRVDGSVLEDLLRPADALRDPVLASFDLQEVREVRIREGGRELRLRRGKGGAAWSAQEDGKPAPAPEARAVSAWLDRVRLLHATAFAPPGTAFSPARSAVLALADGSTVQVELGAQSGDRVPLRASGRPGVVGIVPAESVPAWPLRVQDLRAEGV